MNYLNLWTQPLMVYAMHLIPSIRIKFCYVQQGL